MSGADVVTPANALSDTLQETYLHDQEVWDSCAGAYENRIVGGHPEMTAYEAFEEDTLDRILRFLARDCGKRVHLYDVGCGSGRLHLRYALKTRDIATLPPAQAERIRAIRRTNPAYTHDPVLSEHLHSVGGVDFSESMLKLARARLRNCGCAHLLGSRFSFDRGSAFALKPMPKDLLPVVTCVHNTLGAMQGPEGAIELFKTLRRAVEESGGIAIVSAYCREAVQSYGLSSYEADMEIYGQPRWLAPDTYASKRYIQVPRADREANGVDSTVVVDVYGNNKEMVKEQHILVRSGSALRDALETGHIRTHAGYESYWYPFDLFDRWIKAHWPSAGSYHIAGREIDPLRGEPVQFAILDGSGLLRGLPDRWMDHSQSALPEHYSLADAAK